MFKNMRWNVEFSFGPVDAFKECMIVFEWGSDVLDTLTSCRMYTTQTCY